MELTEAEMRAKYLTELERRNLENLDACIKHEEQRRQLERESWTELPIRRHEEERSRKINLFAQFLWMVANLILIVKLLTDRSK